MDRQEIEEMVKSLLIEQRRLSRLRLRLPPHKEMLLKRLLMRLEGTRMQRKKVSIRYSHQAFMKQIHHDERQAFASGNPMERTTPLVYADWLDENGFPGAAEIVREGAQHSSMPVISTNSPMSPRYEAEARNLPEFEPAVDLYTTLPRGGEHRYILTLTSGDKPDRRGSRRVGWIRSTSPEEAHRLVSGMQGITGASQAQQELESRFPHLKKSQMKRRGLPIKMAKVDSHFPAHRLVAGFPVEHALRHLANDPKNPSHVRDLAYIALTGKNKLTGETKEQGMPEALWALNDALQEIDHPLSTGKPGGYNWMSASDKVLHDQHTHTALSELANDMRRAHNAGAHDDTWPYRPEGQAMRIGQALGSQKHLDPMVRRRNTEMLNRVRARVSDLVPGIDPKHIDESIRRHAHRAMHVWRTEHGLAGEVGERRMIHDDYGERAIQPVEPVTRNASGSVIGRHTDEFHKNEKATRYARLTLSGPKPFRGPMGENMHEHSYHDETGNKLGVIRLQPRNDGEMLHIHWIGPESSKPGETPNTLGPEAVRSLKEQLKPHYPNAKYVTGIRGSGFRTQPERVVKPFRRVKKAIKYGSSFRGDFIEALRRIQSSNQKALHETANRLSKQLGMEPVKILNALYDTTRGATPGIAQAIYGDATPEHIHAMGAWMGLTANIPGVAVFHARPNGPDGLYRFRQDGSGLDIRSKLDRMGLRERVMIPHRTGFDIIIPDRGKRLYTAVRQYTQHHGLGMEASHGHFNTIGSQDQARARDMFRNKVVQSEKKMMQKRKYSRESEMQGFHASFHKSAEKSGKGNFVANDPNTNDHLVFADWLEDQGKVATADAIRRSAGGTGGDVPQIWNAGEGHWLTTPPGQFAALRETPSHPSVSLLQRSLVRPNRHFWWVARYPTIEERDNAIREIISEGAVHIQNEDTDPTPFSSE